MPNSPNSVVTLPVTTVVGPESIGGGGGRWLLRRDCACQMILQVPVQPFSGIVRVTCSNVRDVESHPPAHTHFTHSSSFIFIQLHLHSFPFKLTHTHSNSLILIQTFTITASPRHARTQSVSHARTHSRSHSLTHSGSACEVVVGAVWGLLPGYFFKKN